MILKIIMAIFAPISLILMLSLIMNSVYILVDLPTSIENGQSLARRFFNETISGKYSYYKVISKLQIPALRDLFVAQEQLAQNFLPIMVFDESFQFYATNTTNLDPLIQHLKSYNHLIRTNITVFCENGVFFAYGKQNISIFYEEWVNNVKNCENKSVCMVLDGYSQNWIKPEIMDTYMKFSVLVTILQEYKCLISQRQSLTDFIGYAKSWDPPYISRGLLLNSILYEVNTTNDEFQIGNLTKLSKTYPNQTDGWINQLYEELNDCSYQFKTFEYIGTSKLALICRSTLFFVSNPNIQCPAVNIDIKKQFSIMFLETLTSEYKNQQVGVLMTSLNLNQYLAFQFLVLFILFIYTWRQGVKVALSFVIPLKNISKKIFDQSVLELRKSNFSPQYFEQYRNSKDVSDFLNATISLANSIKYQSNKFELDAEGLMMMSNSKKFFQKQDNLTAVGICCNNIARIHAQNRRYLEALNEQEESIQIAEQELSSLQQLEDFHQKLSTSKNWPEVFYSFKNRMLQRFLGEDQIFERLHSQNYYPQFPKMASSELKQRSYTVQQKQRGLLSSGRLSSDRQRNNLFTIHQNNITSLAYLQKVEQSNQSFIKEDQVIEDDPRQIIKLRLLNRKYQLLQILSQFSNQHDQLFLNEILLLLLQMKKEGEEYTPQSSFILNFRLCVSCQLVYFYTKSNQITKAKLLLRNLKDNQIVEDQELYSSTNIFNETPQPLIASKLSLLKAFIAIKTNKITSSCKRLLTILMTPIYDFNQYGIAYNLLMKIFQSYSLNTNVLSELRLTTQKNFEVIILIDYTNQITPEQIKLAHFYSKFILSKMDNQDQVGLYAFNSIFHQIFPLQNYQKFLENSLNRLLLPPGGESQLLNLLKLAAGQFFMKNKVMQKQNTSIVNSKATSNNLSVAGDILDKCLQTDYHDYIEDEDENDYSRKFIVLFAEMISDFTQVNLEILKQILFKRKVHLIVIMFANQNINKIYLEKLSQVTSESCLLRPKEVCSYFSKLRPHKNIKKQYIEFF